MLWTLRSFWQPPNNLPDIIDLTTEGTTMEKKTQNELQRKLAQGIKHEGADFFILVEKLVRAKKLDRDRADVLIIRHYV
jgi:hypothetical protein